MAFCLSSACLIKQSWYKNERKRKRERKKIKRERESDGARKINERKSHLEGIGREEKRDSDRKREIKSFEGREGKRKERWVMQGKDQE